MFDDLGPVISRHGVANRRRWENAGWALVIGVPTGCVGLWALSGTGDGESAGGRKMIGVLIGLGLSGLFIAVTQAVRAVRGGAGEYFEVREHGLLHGSRRGKASWPWDQIATVTIKSSETDNALTARLGTGYRCVLGLADGRSVRFDGLTDQHGELGLVVLNRCPDATRLTGDEWQRKAGGWLLAGTATCLAAIGAMVLYITGHPDTEREVTAADGMSVHQVVPGISDTGIALLAVGMVVCAIAAVTLVALFVRGRMRH
ncbi:hypothetical protein ACFU9X_45580 [Streptomyces atratus]|uniref:hypothetical protein n=1 Tax=Streptomyces atratus TaxID=1893 RepID=UPI0036A1E76D